MAGCLTSNEILLRSLLHFVLPKIPRLLAFPQVPAEIHLGTFPGRLPGFKIFRHSTMGPL